MLITEMIAQLTELKDKHGDLPVLISTDKECGDYFPFADISEIDFIENHHVVNEDDGSEEFLTFIALDFM